MPKIQCGVLGCECTCHRAKVRQPARLWTPGMDRTVTEAIERGDHIRTIAARLHLTEDSIRWRVKQLGLSLRDGWYSRQEISVLLGVGRRHVDRWMHTGLLPVTRHGTRWTRIRQADLLTFVQAHAGVQFDPVGITDPVLRRLADVSATVNRRREAAS